MRIKIEPSVAGTPDYYRRVQIEVDNDDLDLDELFDSLIIPALRAFGYAEAAIGRYVSVDAVAEDEKKQEYTCPAN